jgi:hypothetical protein
MEVGSSRDGDGGCSSGDFVNVVTGSKWWRNMQRYMGLLLDRRNRSGKGGGRETCRDTWACY